MGLVRFDVLPLDGLDEAFLAHHLLKVNQDDFALLDRSRLVRGVDPDVGDEQVGSLGQRRPRLALDDLLRDQALGHHHCAEQFSGPTALCLDGFGRRRPGGFAQPSSAVVPLDVVSSFGLSPDVPAVGSLDGDEAPDAFVGLGFLKDADALGSLHSAPLGVHFSVFMDTKSLSLPVSYCN